MARSYNHADLFEIVADATPDRIGLVAGKTRLTYRELDERANRVAHALAAAGVGHGDRVGLLAYNRAEWLEAQIAAYKIRAIPINVNYRYTADELAYVIKDAGCAALVGERSLIARLGPARDALDTLRTVLVVEDGSADPVDGTGYEEALAAASPERDFGERSSDDLYLLYTGGTTGMPKGVMWRCEDVFYAAMGGGNMVGPPVESPEALGVKAVEGGLVIQVNAPLMHGAGMWVAWAALSSGSTLVLWTERQFGAEGVLRLAAEEHVQVMVLVGDSMARPIADLLDQGSSSYDLSALFAITTGGSVTSPDVKQRLHAHIPSLILLLDVIGGSESGTAGQGAPPVKGEGEAGGGLPRFTPRPDVAVLDENLRPVAPGSGQIGVFARTGRLPIGYWNDPAKTAATFVTDADGTRWVLQGDMAQLDADGTMVLLGRGSLVINTGGEKVYVEEVEAALKGHPAVYDALVVGVPDERMGSRVGAVVSLTAPVAEDELVAHCRTTLAGYKVPREIRVVEEVRRSPAGKADYRWAREIAAS
jgi:fatty-acyl-CoA synthase